MRRVMYYVSRLLIAVVLLLSFSLPAAAATDVSDYENKPKTIEPNKVYTGTFEKKGDRDCFQFKSGGGSFKVIVWFIPGEIKEDVGWDERVNMSYGEYYMANNYDGSTCKSLGKNGIIMHMFITPDAIFDPVLEGDYVKETVDIGSFKKGKEAGLIFEGKYKGTYKFKVVGKKYVVQKSIKDATVTVASATYSGAAVKPKVTVKLGKTTLKSGTDYTIKFANNINAGNKASVTVTGKGNYKDTVKKTFTINKKPIKEALQITLSKTSYTYDGKAKKPTFSIYLPAANSSGTIPLQNKTDYTYKYENNVEPGTAKLVITGKGNFTGTTYRKFTIDKKSSFAEV